MITLPTIRIDLEGMKYSVIHALGMHNQEMEKAVEDALAEAIKSFDMTKIVREQTRGIVQQALTRGIESGVYEVFKDKEVKKAIKTALAVAIASQSDWD